MFITWDKLFGSFVPEQDGLPLHYGLVKNLGTFNPLRVAFHEFIGIGHDLVRPGLSLRQRLAYLFAPPGWSHDGSRMTTADIKRAAAVKPQGLAEAAELLGFDAKQSLQSFRLLPSSSPRGRRPGGGGVEADRRHFKAISIRLGDAQN